MRGRVLIVAGSDSGGGAGIQADIKTVTALGGYAATAVTAITAQNTLGVQGVQGLDPSLIRLQIQVVMEDIGADCIKTGMLHDAPVIDAVADVLESQDTALPIVVDPVMFARSGDRLLVGDAVERVRARMLPLATVITPNLAEARELSGLPIECREQQIAAARALKSMGPEAVLVKGGSSPGSSVVDILATRNGETEFEWPRIDTRSTHGTGCTLASAIATGLAQGQALEAAIRRARAYVQEALRTAPDIGSGNGPLNHGHTVRPFEG
jgi:hydroxymethylpyrimidine/phosphomethylpyrimidine kinase